MDPQLSDPGAHFVEKSKSLPFHELPKDAPATLDAFQRKAEEVSETPRNFGMNPAEKEAEKYGTVTFRDDSTTLADLKAHSLSSNPIVAFFQKKAEKYPGFFRRFSPKYLLWVVVLLICALLAGGGAWAASWYVRNVKVFPVMSVLPASPDLALEVNINPDSEEYALLETHASVFPGYDLLKKSLDPVGEGKTLSRVFQDSFKHFGLDFEGDIRPVLSDSAFVVVSDMSPIGESIQKSSVAFGSSVSQTISRAFSSTRREIAFSNRDASSSHPKVLGDMTVRGVESDFAPTKPLDFLVASPIRNREKALQTLEKMKKGAEFDVEPKEFHGLSYFKVSLRSGKKEGAPDDLSRFVRFRTLYHAFVGGNWVFGSSEDEIKRVLERQSARNAIGLFMSEKPMETLTDNMDFRSVRHELGNPAISESLIIGYFNVASETFLKHPSCSGSSCFDASEWFRYPERMILGWSLGLTESGVDMRLTSASENEPFPGKPESERFSSMIPEKADGKWLNIFSEHDALKSRFYDFKRAQLTDAGRNAWEEFRNTLRTATTVDIERDVIDHLSGGSAFSVFTAGDAEPEGVFVAHVDDPKAVRASIEKVTTFVRNMVLSWQSMLPPMGVSMTEENIDFDALLAKPVFSETQTPEGTIYSFKLSNEFPFSLLSFDFGFKDNVIVLGTHFVAVQTFLREMGNGSEKKLSRSDFYRSVRSAVPEEHYQNSFVVTRGVWDIVGYYMKTMSRMAESMGVLSEGGSEDVSATSPSLLEVESETNDLLFAIGAIFRTMKLIGSESVSRDGFETSSSRIVIESLPLEEKERAERILEEMSSEISAMDLK